MRKQLIFPTDLSLPARQPGSLPVYQCFHIATWKITDSSMMQDRFFHQIELVSQIDRRKTADFTQKGTLEHKGIRSRHMMQKMFCQKMFLFLHSCFREEWPDNALIDAAVAGYGSVEGSDQVFTALKAFIADHHTLFAVCHALTPFGWIDVVSVDKSKAYIAAL